MLGFWDVLFPKRCVGCKKWGCYVCEKCEVGMWEVEQICPECNKDSDNGLRHDHCKNNAGMEGLICLWANEGATLKLIKEAKSKRYFDYLGALVVNRNDLECRTEFSNFYNFIETKPLVTSIPIDWGEEKEQGYNQAEIIARLISRKWHLVYKNVLSKMGTNKYQANNGKEERFKVIEGSVKLTKRINCSGVVLVDGVWKTGIIMRECAKVLKKAGVKKVWGLVLAR